MHNPDTNSSQKGSVPPPPPANNAPATNTSAKAALPQPSRAAPPPKPAPQKVGTGGASSFWLAAGAGLAGIALASLLPKAVRRATRRKDSDAQAMITIDHPAADLYQRWRDHDRLEALVPALLSVAQDGGEGFSEWRLRDEDGATRFIRTRLAEDQRNQLLVWENAEAPGERVGWISFCETERGTVVRLELHLHAHAGRLANVAGRIAGKAGAAPGVREARATLLAMKAAYAGDAAPPSPFSVVGNEDLSLRAKAARA